MFTVFLSTNVYSLAIEKQDATGLVRICERYICKIAVESTQDRGVLGNMFGIPDATKGTSIKNVAIMEL